VSRGALISSLPEAISSSGQIQSKDLESGRRSCSSNRVRKHHCINRSYEENRGRIGVKAELARIREEIAAELDESRGIKRELKEEERSSKRHKRN
jgi:hypothetical protein